MCVLVFRTTFAWNISHSKKIRARYGKNCISVFMWSVQFAFTESLIFSTDFLFFGKNTAILNLVQIRQVGAESMRTDRRTDKKNLVVSFLNFAKKGTTKMYNLLTSYFNVASVSQSQRLFPQTTLTGLSTEWRTVLTERSEIKPYVLPRTVSGIKLLILTL